MSDELTNLIASRFIQRRDVKAKQLIVGKERRVLYVPDGTRDEDGNYVEYFPWERKALNQHIAGQSSYGHYLLDQESNCKLFAFDIDLEKIGWLPVDEEFSDFRPATPRDDWRVRSHVHQRNFIKLQFKTLAHLFLRAIESELQIPCAAAYSGGKGIHVYGFTGSIPAAEARLGAQIVLDHLERFKPAKGTSFFADKNEDHETGFQNLSIELFPKQDSLDGKDLGNLMRLPLGKNLKNSKDPTFFIDMTAPLGVMRAVDPVHALTADNPWTSPNG